MVEAEERRIEERKKGVQQQQESKAQTQTQSQGKTNQQAKETEAKNKIVSEHKSAGKVDNEEAHKIEEANMARQEEKEGNAAVHAVADSVKVKDRGGYGGK